LKGKTEERKQSARIKQQAQVATETKKAAAVKAKPTKAQLQPVNDMS